jgi:hypothetical protein
MPPDVVDAALTARRDDLVALVNNENILNAGLRPGVVNHEERYRR